VCVCACGAVCACVCVCVCVCACGAVCVVAERGRTRTSAVPTMHTPAHCARTDTMHAARACVCSAGRARAPGSPAAHTRQRGWRPRRPRGAPEVPRRPARHLGQLSWCGCVGCMRARVCVRVRVRVYMSVCVCVCGTQQTLNARMRWLCLPAARVVTGPSSAALRQLIITPPHTVHAAAWQHAPAWAVQLGGAGAAAGGAGAASCATLARAMDDAASGAPAAAGGGDVAVDGAAACGSWRAGQEAPVAPMAPCCCGRDGWRCLCS
jgi:hypothetical protein